MNISRLATRLVSISSVAFLTATLIFATSCNKEKKQSAHPDWSEARTEMETRGATLLASARTALAQGEFSVARNYIQQLRDECRLAFDARNAAILLLDSIEIQDAMQQLVEASKAQSNDSVKAHVATLDQKVKFYQRKLDHDKQTPSRGK